LLVVAVPIVDRRTALRKNDSTAKTRKRKKRNCASSQERDVTPQKSRRVAIRASIRKKIAHRNMVKILLQEE
jgi:hypothetical protein